MHRDDLKVDKQLSIYYFLLARMSGIALLNTQGNDQKRRLLRVLRHSINHKILLDFMEIAGLREFFSKLEKLLEAQPHYWLQRASFEVEKGNLDSAKNYIENAFMGAPRDPLVITTSAYIDIKRALAYPSDASLKSKGEKGFEILMELVDGGHEKDSHAFHIIGSQGLAWSRKYSYSRNVERRNWLEKLLKYTEKGCSKYPSSSELQQLRMDIRREIISN